MKALKPLLPFGRVPVLLAPGGNGKTFALAQSDAIVRHLYRKASSEVQASTPLLFSPMAEEHLAMADMWYEQVKESFGAGPWGKAFNISALREGTAADLEAAVVNRKKRSVPLRRPGNSSRNVGGGKTKESQSQTQMLAESTLE